MIIYPNCPECSGKFQKDIGDDVQYIRFTCPHCGKSWCQDVSYFAEWPGHLGIYAWREYPVAVRVEFVAPSMVRKIPKSKNPEWWRRK